jgi:hypothetical protein
VLVVTSVILVDVAGMVIVATSLSTIPATTTSPAVYAWPPYVISPLADKYSDDPLCPHSTRYIGLVAAASTFVVWEAVKVLAIKRASP